MTTHIDAPQPGATADGAPAADALENFPSSPYWELEAWHMSPMEMQERERAWIHRNRASVEHAATRHNQPPAHKANRF